MTMWQTANKKLPVTKIRWMNGSMFVLFWRDIEMLSALCRPNGCMTSQVMIYIWMYVLMYGAVLVQCRLGLRAKNKIKALVKRRCQELNLHHSHRELQFLEVTDSSLSFRKQRVRCVGIGHQWHDILACRHLMSWEAEELRLVHWTCLFHFDRTEQVVSGSFLLFPSYICSSAGSSLVCTCVHDYGQWQHSAWRQRCVWP